MEVVWYWGVDDDGVVWYGGMMMEVVWYGGMVVKVVWYGGMVVIFDFIPGHILCGFLKDINIFEFPWNV